MGLLLHCHFTVVTSLRGACVKLSLRFVIRFVSLTSVRLGLRRHSYCCFYSELHWLLGGVATFLWLLADFLSPPFLKRFQL